MLIKNIIVTLGWRIVAGQRPLVVQVAVVCQLICLCGIKQGIPCTTSIPNAHYHAIPQLACSPKQRCQNPQAALCHRHTTKCKIIQTYCAYIILLEWPVSSNKGLYPNIFKPNPNSTNNQQPRACDSYSCMENMILTLGWRIVAGQRPLVVQVAVVCQLICLCTEQSWFMHLALGPR